MPLQTVRQVVSKAIGDLSFAQDDITPLYLYITESMFVDINVSVMNISHPTRFMCILCVGDWLADLTGKIDPHRTILCPWRSVSFMIHWKH